MYTLRFARTLLVFAVCDKSKSFLRFYYYNIIRQFGLIKTNLIILTENILRHINSLQILLNVAGATCTKRKTIVIKTLVLLYFYLNFTKDRIWFRNILRIDIICTWSLESDDEIIYVTNCFLTYIFSSFISSLKILSIVYQHLIYTCNWASNSKWLFIIYDSI
jgi:hypothetical protein